MPPVLFPHACFDCRRSFKRPPTIVPPYERKCPYCGGSAKLLSRKFKPPRQSDVKQWRKVKFLYDHGFRFDETIWDKVNQKQIKFPETLLEAREFVKKYADRAHAANAKPSSSQTPSASSD